jgi:hypothetical protein
MFGMFMLHEFLAQFEEGAAYVKRSNPKFGLRWVTWPSNTFCAAVAWRNYPPAEGTPATILNAVANLDRVRALKMAARDAKVVGRHQQALAAARRREELQSAVLGAAAAVASTSSVGDNTSAAGSAAPSPSVPNPPAEIPAKVSGSARDGSRDKSVSAKPSRLGSSDADEVPASGMRLPSTAATALEWANLWVKMCTDPEFGLGPISDEDARARYDLTAKQLRNVRHAAVSGALRQRAMSLGVELPEGYVDNPASDRAEVRDAVGTTV